MKLEDRLRAELERSGRSTRVGVAPSVDELAAVAGRRHRRNRLVGTVGVGAVSALVLISAVIAAQPDDDQVVVASGDDATAAEVADGDGLVPNADESAASEAAAAAPATTSDDSDVLDQLVAGVERIDGDSATEVDPAGDVIVTTPPEVVDVPTVADGMQRVLQGPESALNVSVRDSAVEFAGGSGVLLVPNSDGYRGLATAFDDAGGRLIGLSSINGLDWVEVELSGVPAGTVATTLRAHDGGYVALFDRFDSESGSKQMFVGVSTDLVSWDLSPALEGRDVVATDLAVGPNGVMVIGDDFAPDVWFGPLGGPYELSGRLEVSMLFGVTTVDDEFLVAGRSFDGGAKIFTSTDGLTFEVGELGQPGDGELGVALADGTIIVTTAIDEEAATVVSSDGGDTWELLGEGAIRSLSVNGAALGFLGGVDGDASVTLSDGDSFATAQLDVEAPDRVALLSTTADQAIMLVNDDEGGLTWVVASR